MEETREKADDLIRLLNGTEESDGVSMMDGVLDFLRQQSEGEQEYFKTGFSRLDKYSYMSRSDFVIIGGRPSAGKTAFSLALALNFADNTDAKMETMLEVLKSGGENPGWLGYNRFLETNVRKTTPTEQ